MRRRPNTPKAVHTLLRRLLRTAPRSSASLVHDGRAWFGGARLWELLVAEWPGCDGAVGTHMVEDCLKLMRRQGSAVGRRFYRRTQRGAPRYADDNGGDFTAGKVQLWAWPTRAEALDAWVAEKALAREQDAFAPAERRGRPASERQAWRAEWVSRHRADLDLLFDGIYRPATNGGAHASG